MKDYRIKFTLNGYVHYTLIKAKDYTHCLLEFERLYVPYGAKIIHIKQGDYCYYGN